MERRSNSRRNFLKTVGVGTAALAIPNIFKIRDLPQDKRTNILIFMADDWNWPHAFHVYDPNIKTPTFDRIVREGVMFRNAFVASPSCTPSRASMLTGMHPWQLHNLAQDPDYAAIKEMLAANLEEKLRRTKNPRILGTFEEIFYTRHYENQKKRPQEK